MHRALTMADPPADPSAGFLDGEDRPSLDDLAEFDDAEVAALMRDAEAEAPDASLTLRLVASRALPRDFLDDADADAIADAVAALECVRLDGCRLANLGGPEGPLSPSAGALRNITSLYLQRNRLVTTDGVRGDALPSLRFLALQENRLESLPGVSTLTTLMFLDVGDNPTLSGLAEVLGSIPASTRFLRVEGTRVATEPDARPAFVASLPELKRLDDRDVTREERESALVLFGEDPSEDESSSDAENAPEDDAALTRAVAEMRLKPTESKSETKTKTNGAGPESVSAAAAAAAVLANGAISSTTNPSEAEEDRARLRAVLSTLNEPGVHSTAAANALSSSASSDVRRARDRASERASTRLEETRDGEVDVDARVRRAQRQHGAAMREAGAMMAFYQEGAADGEGEAT